MSAGAFDARLVEALVAGVGDAVVIVDPRGTIVYWNEGAAATFGHPAAEALGRGLELIVPERLWARHAEGFDAAVASGGTRYGDRLLAVPARHRDGRTLSIEFRVALLRGADGRLAGVGAVIRDVTERWAEHRRLLERVRELEARAADPS